METYDAIMTRRSVPKVTTDRPTREEIAKILDAAVRAPTHHLTQPWRFVVLTADACSQLGDAWAEAERRTGGKDPELVRSKPLRAPVIVTVIGRPKSHLPKVVEREEHIAVGALLQNMLLAAHDMGLGAMIRTGPAGEFDEVRKCIGVEDDEYIAGFVYVGYPDPSTPERPPTRRTPATEITEWRGW